MTEGPIASKVLMFAIPLMLSSMLQLAYNAADIIVVGRYSGSHALAAVGSTTSLINLIINIFIGISAGAGAVIARYYGSDDRTSMRETVHTTMAIGIISGVVVAAIGITLARPMLELMGAPSDVIDLSTLYLRIYFIGAPANMIYNFGSSVLRAVGDTKRPLYFLTVSGIVNVILNLVFVAGLGMSVDGVAIATVTSQILSAVFVVLCLMRMDGGCHLVLRDVRIYKGRLAPMLRIGLPTGFQGTLFSLSNVLIQSSINSFGAIVVAGNSAASNIENFVYFGMNAFHHAALTFAGQNYGAGKIKRIKKVTLCCLAYAGIIGAVLGCIAYAGSGTLLKIFSSDQAVIDAGVSRMMIICTTYFLCGFMDTMVGALRGMGCSLIPMISSLVGVCGFRILWIYTVFAANRHNIMILYASYPISWSLTVVAHIVTFVIVYTKAKKKASEPMPDAAIS